MSNTGIKDYYYILGLSRDASNEEIKEAYRKLSVKFHPDHNNGDKFFEERFKDILEAYETLSDEVKRKVYNDKLKGGNTSPEPSYVPTPQKKRPRNKLYAILGGLVFFIPVGIKLAVNKINESEKEKKYNSLYLDTTHRTRNDSVILLKVYDTTVIGPPAAPSADNGHLNADPPVKPDTDQLSKFKDDDGLTAEDAVNYFFNAFNNNDCNTAWDMSYNSYWVQQGKDWFCSSGAFGGVKKVVVKSMQVVLQYATVAQVYMDYYAEDIYNGNKCFKQNISVQKFEYTDNKMRWKLTKMINAEEPVVCNE